MRAARDYFRCAVNISPTNDQYIQNVVDAMVRDGDSLPALDYIREHLSAVTKPARLQASRAGLLAQSGKTAEALEAYASAFSGDFVDDRQLDEYVSVLCSNKQTDRAEAVVEEYLKHRDSVAVRMTKAGALRCAKKFDESLKVLDEQIARNRGNAALALERITTLSVAERFTDALRECDQLMESGHRSAGVCFAKGRAELGLKRYREAKECFEQAARQEPSNATIKGMLDQVSGLLGQGSNTCLKTPIEAVRIPETVIARGTAGGCAGRSKEFAAFYETSAQAVFFKKDFEYRVTDYQTVKVTGDAAIPSFSAFEFSFDPLSEEIYVNTLTVRDAEGKTVSEGKVDDYYIIDDTTLGQASHRKLLHIPVSGVRSGCEISIMVTRKYMAAPKEFPFQRHCFVRTFPAMRDLLYVEAEPNSFKSGASAGVEFQSLKGDSKSPAAVWWTVEDPPVYRYEPLQLPIEKYIPSLWIGGLNRTWKDVGLEYLKLIEDRLQPDETVHKACEDRIAGISKPEQKIAVLARSVQNEITYKAIEFGRRARIPNKAATVIANRYGDCKDHALLLRQLLQEAGIEAHLALVNTSYDVHPEAPTLDQFDHMILYVPSLHNKGFIDCTDKTYNMVECVPYGLAKERALVLEPKNPRLVLIPDYANATIAMTLTRTVEIENETDARVHEEIETTQVSASGFRSMLRNVEAVNRQSAFQRELGNTGGLELHNFSVEGLEEVTKPLTLHLDYVLKDRFHRVNGEIIGQLPALLERRFLSYDQVEKRVSPFWRQFPLKLHSHTSLVTPRGWSPAKGKPAEIGEARFAALSATQKMEGATLEFEADTVGNAGQFPATEYAVFQKTLRQVADGLEPVVVLKRQQ